MGPTPGVVTYIPQKPWPEGRNQRWNEYTALLATEETISGQSVAVQASNNTEFNYWFVKDVVDKPAKELNQDAKVQIALPHAKIVYASGEQELISKLDRFLQNKPAWQPHMQELRGMGKQGHQPQLKKRP